MTDFINAIEPALMDLLATVVAVVFSYVGIECKRLYSKYVDSNSRSLDAQHKKQIVSDVVHCVEQVYTDAEGPDKLQKALNQASMLLSNHGIKVSEEELRTLIESAVHGMNADAGA